MPNTAIKVLGDPIVAGLPEGVTLTIPGVDEITSMTVRRGYMAEQELEDAAGNVGTVVLSHYGAQVDFEGTLAEDAEPPPVGAAASDTDAGKITLTIDGETFAIAFLSACQVAYTPTGRAAVSGTVKAWSKLS